MYSRVKPAGTRSFTLLWRDENDRLLALDRDYIVYYPKTPSLHRVTLDLCEVRPVGRISEGGERFRCPKAVATASHVLRADLRGKVAVTLDGPETAWTNVKVQVHARVTNLAPADPLPDLYYYWRAPAMKSPNPVTLPMNRDFIIYGQPQEGPATVTVQVKQRVLGKMQILAEASHTINYVTPHASVSVDGPSSARIGDRVALSAIVRFPKAQPNGDLRFKWTEEKDGLRLSSTDPIQTVNTSQRASYAIRVDVFLRLDGNDVEVGSARHVLLVEDAAEPTETRRPDRVAEALKKSNPELSKAEGDAICGCITQLVARKYSDPGRHLVIHSPFTYDPQDKLCKGGWWEVTGFSTQRWWPVDMAREDCGELGKLQPQQTTMRQTLTDSRQASTPTRSVTGTWQGTWKNTRGESGPWTITLVETDGKVEGADEGVKIIDGRRTGNTMTWRMELNGGVEKGGRSWTETVQILDGGDTLEANYTGRDSDPRGPYTGGGRLTRKK